MNTTPPDELVDVSNLPPRERHPLIFSRWENLPAGSALLLRNDHDPLPLYYQFAAEFAGEFRWEYVETGPARWAVRIARGDFPEPGFVPARRRAPAAVPIVFADRRAEAGSSKNPPASVPA